MFKKIFYITICYIAIQSTLIGQTWQQKVLSGGQDGECKSVVLTPDGGSAYTGSLNNNTSLLFYKIDADGRKLIQKIFTNNNNIIFGNDLIATPTGYIVAGQYSQDAYLLKLDVFGNKIADKTFGGPQNDVFEAIVSNGNNLFAVGSSQLANLKYGYLVKFNTNGDTIYSKVIGSPNTEFHNIDYNGDGSLVIVGETKINGDQVANVTKVDPNGVVLWSKNFGTAFTKFNACSINRNDGTVYICGMSGSRGLLFKLDIDGNKLWEKSIPNGNISELKNLTIDELQRIVAVGYIENGTNTNILISKIDLNGNNLSIKDLGSNNSVEQAYDIEITDNKHYCIAGSNFNNLFSDAFILKTDTAGFLNSSYIEGNIFYDLNNNGIKDGNDKYLNNWIVKINHSNKISFASTNTDGKFSIAVDTGSYTIEVIPSNENWKANRLTYNVDITNTFDTTQILIPVINKFLCPKLYTDMGVPALQPCVPTEYVISYENKGPANANDCYIIVKVDKRINVTSSSIPWTSNVNNEFRFDLNTLSNGVKGSIKLQVTPECGPLQLGLSYETTAHIYPDSICDISPLWDKSSLELLGECIGNQVTFKVKNNGSQPSVANIKYIVIEDDIMFLKNPIGNPILPGDSIIIKPIRTPGKTLRCSVEQSANHPDKKSQPTVCIEGCQNPSGIINAGYKTMYPENDGRSNYEVDVRESIASNSSITMSAQPKGYDRNKTDKNHFITKNTDIEYTIPYTNNGTDTIRTLIIIDSLSDLLNPSSLEAGSGTFNYQYEVYGKGIIRFSMENIALAPSKTAFVKYRITQDSNNTSGQIIFNKADIYTNYQKPNTTVQTKHTIGVDFIEVILKTIQPNFADLQLTVVPNPVIDEAIITVSTTSRIGNLHLQLYDIVGKPIKVLTTENTEFHLRRNDLPAGVYLFEITTDGLHVGSGKIIIE